MRAAVYLRISQDKTGEQAGVTRQREDCLALVDEQGWDLTEVYQDNDISASTGAPRPAYDRLLVDIRGGRVDALVAWHPDRLYRKVRTLEDLLDAIEKQNIVLRTVRAGELDLSTPTGRMLARIVSAISQGEGEVKADRWMRSWRQGRESGAPARTGSRMFGYTGNHQPECAGLTVSGDKCPGCDTPGYLVEVEAAIAQKMADDVLAGVPILAIARRLQAEGVPTTRGGTWRPGTIRQYLSNPRIAGHSTLKGNIVAEGKWDPILDRDTWETVRALLNSRARPMVPRVSLVNGLLFCGTCGTRMITSGTRGKRTYRCPNRPGMNGCGGVSGYAEPIEEVVESYARGRLDDPRVRTNIARLASLGAPHALAEIAAVEQRIAELEAQLDEPGIPVTTILRAIDRSRERLEEAQQQLTASVPVPLPATGGEWPADLERRRRLIDLVVERVTLNAATKRVKYFDVERVAITPR